LNRIEAKEIIIIIVMAQDLVYSSLVSMEGLVVVVLFYA